MGMFDNISVTGSLPTNQDMKDLELDINNHSWQTKDLSNVLSQYYIQGGRLFEQRYKVEKWIEGDKNSKSFIDRFGHLEREEPYLEPVYHHGEIYFYDMINDVKDKWDCWIEYKAVFTNGGLDRYELVEFKKTSNEERKQRDKEFKDNIERNAKLWYNKYLFHTKAYRFFSNKWYRFWNKAGDTCQKIAFIVYK